MQTMMNHSVYFIAYASCFNDDTLDNKALTMIFEQSQYQNPKHQVTGFLCFGRGCFFQYIEGSKQAIEQLYANIIADDRHHSIVLLDSGYQPKHRFWHWAMVCTSFDKLMTIAQVPKKILDKKPTAWQKDETAIVIQKMSEYHLSSNSSEVVRWQSHMALHWYDFWFTHRPFLILQLIIISLLALVLIWWLIG